MEKINVSIQNVPENVPIIFNINIGMRLYSKVKLFVPKVNGKPSVAPGNRWYIYFYFENPITKKKEKFNYTRKINRLATVKERKEYGEALVTAYDMYLAGGFNPFEVTEEKIKDFEQTNYTVKSGLNYAYDNKLGTWKGSTADDYKTRLGVFLQWVKDNDLENKNIRDLQEIHIISFMNWLIKPKPDGRGVGGTSQDNYKRCLSGLIGKLVKDKIISKNIISDIETKKDDPLKNTPFTGYEVKAIRDYLLVNDVQLYRFIQFVIYTFLRPREIIRLTVDDVNLREKYLRVETKTKTRDIKKLVGPIIDYFESINIKSLPSGAHIFTNTGLFEVWNAKEKTKVDHFGHRFEKVKTHFKFGKDYGIYSFRHTAALDLFFAFMKQGLTEREAILKLMPITGHATETALRNYLRDVGGMLPKDYGSDYTLEF
jgi:integrase